MFRKLTEHVYILEHDDYKGYCNLGYIFSKDIFGDKNYDSALPKTKDCFLVEAGFSKHQLDLLRSELTKLSLPFPTKGSITHSHYDHAFGIKDSECKFLVTKNFIDNIHFLGYQERFKDTESKVRWLDRVDDKLNHRVSYYIHVEFEDIMEALDLDVKKQLMAYNSEDEKKELELFLGYEDQVHIRLIPTYKDCHSQDTTLIYVVEDKVLFVGDSCYYDVFDKFDDYSPEDCSEFFNLVLSLDVDYYVLGHDKVCTRQTIEKLYKEHMFYMFNISI